MYCQALERNLQCSSPLRAAAVDVSWTVFGSPPVLALLVSHLSLPMAPLGWIIKLILALCKLFCSVLALGAVALKGFVIQPEH